MAAAELSSTKAVGTNGPTIKSQSKMKMKTIQATAWPIRHLIHLAKKPA